MLLRNDVSRTRVVAALGDAGLAQSLFDAAIALSLPSVILSGAVPSLAAVASDGPDDGASRLSRAAGVAACVVTMRYVAVDDRATLTAAGVVTVTNAAEVDRCSNRNRLVDIRVQALAVGTAVAAAAAAASLQFPSDDRYKLVGRASVTHVPTILAAVGNDGTVGTAAISPAVRVNALQLVAAALTVSGAVPAVARIALAQALTAKGHALPTGTADVPALDHAPSKLHVKVPQVVTPPIKVAAADGDVTAPGITKALTSMPKLSCWSHADAGAGAGAPPAAATATATAAAAAAAATTATPAAIALPNKYTPLTANRDDAQLSSLHFALAQLLRPLVSLVDFRAPVASEGVRLRIRVPVATSDGCRLHYYYPGTPIPCFCSVH